ncbi:MAG: SprT family zinc-dependent metalloprotease [Thiovulaceae bacterium]|nr:SprT family zinc-dependent metalloprotease [Sulfurimonadaceae bacterium]
MNSLEILGLHVSYTYNPRLKNSYINILPSAKIVVKTPINSQKHIRELIQSKHSWIVKKINHIEKYQKVNVNLEDEVLIFGELYSVDHEVASILREKLSKSRSVTNENIVNLYDGYYKEMALQYIPKRVEYFSRIMGLYPSNIKYRKMKRRWGSCDSKKELTFNIYLLKLSRELIDYVIVHELSHIKHMNHSKRFHELVSKYLINAKELEKKIQEEYYKFMLQ